MITIDHISFEFAMNDESFAHNLYAEWDSFCRTCVESILEECLSVYDKDRMLHEIEKFDLELGNIPQEDFYSEFPKRLREELLKALPSLQLGQTNMEEVKTVASRFVNLLYYLEHGVFKTEWADVGFNLSEELDELMMQDKRYMEKIAGLCMANEYVLRRLLWQADNDIVLVHLYSTAMDQTFSVKNEKRRFMEIFLEMQPDLPVRFVHEVEEDGRLRSMAELLDTRSVHRMMEKEAEEHAEVDLPPYWHYLYEWLIKYYPFNGVAVFGGKSNFISHLHYRLLTFIHKRNHTFYLSKTELTASFLFEVFGTAYYKEVLNAIYNMQSRNADGSPAYDGYYNRELYHIFIQLSLLNLPGTLENVMDVNVPTKDTDSLLADFRMEDLSFMLKDAGRNEADKKMIVATLVRKKPEELIAWLRSEAIRDKTLMAVMAGLIDGRTLKQLLVSISLTAIETVDESTKSLLQLIHKGVIGKDNETTVDEWTEELHLSENEAKNLRVLIGQDKNEIKENIRRLRILLTAGDIAEAVKRRLVIFLLEQLKDRYADVILELHEEGLLEDAINLMSPFAMESVIRQMAVRYMGTDGAEKLLLLIDRLLANEKSVSAYLKNKSLTLKAQVFVWLAKEAKAQIGTVKVPMELFSFFLASLVGKENVSAVVRSVLYGMAGEVATDETKNYDILGIIDLLSYTGSFHVRHAMSVFEQWSQNIKAHSNTVQTLLQSHWNTSGSFMEWLKDTGVATESKHELLQAWAREKPQELTAILRDLSPGEETVPFMAVHFSKETLLDVAAKTDAKQGLLLSRTIDLLQRERGRFAFLATMTMSFTTALSEALLLFMQDNDTLGGRNLTEQEVVGKFLVCLYYVYTRKTDYQDNAEWNHLQDEVINGAGLSDRATSSEDTISERLLSEYGSLNEAKLYALVIDLLDKQPEQFIGLFESKANTEFIKRISGIADRAMLSHILLALSFANGFEYRATFGRLMEWLSTVSVDHIPASDMVSVLLSWINTTDWKRQAIRQMTLFFIARLYGSDDAAKLPLEMLTDDTLPEEVRKQLFRNYIHSRPKELLSHIQQLAAEGRLAVDKWAKWAGLSEWLRLAASVSFTLEELLRQVIEYLLYQNKLIDETTLRYGLATFIATNDAAKFTYYVDKEEVVRSFVQSLPVVQEKTVEKKEETISQVMKDLNMMPAEESLVERNEENDQEIAFVGNAGLCLLSPWFPQLFGLLSYLDEEKRTFKDTASRIRAVFLLQYLAYQEEKEYYEPELAFNRLLVALPAHIPLPKRIELTDKEKQIVNGMLESVKANWSKMDGTSVSGFRQSFIVRNGQLEQQDEKWLLTVESRVYDILLEAIPWAFRQIRFPWIKKYIQVFWHEKQEF